MGWSCRAEAGATMDAWVRACVAQTGSSNVFRRYGSTFFFECDNVEHDDGAITGAIFQMDGEDQAHEVSQFRIEGDGEVSSAPMFLRLASPDLTSAAA